MHCQFILLRGNSQYISVFNKKMHFVRLSIPKIRILYPPNAYHAPKSDREISFLAIFGYRIGYKYPLLYILPMSGP
jgi:hypothetical protein